MKKFTLKIIVVLSLLILPNISTYAQGLDPIEVPGPSQQENQDSEEGDTPRTPETGIAPSGRVAQNIAVFVGGSAIGLAIGFGIISLQRVLRGQEAEDDNFYDK